MAKNLIVVTVEENLQLTIEELCHACNLTEELVYEIVEQGAVEPDIHEDGTLRFGPEHLRRVKRIAHLHEDLDINISGAALVLDLIDEMEAMRSRIELLEKYLSG